MDREKKRSTAKDWASWGREKSAAGGSSYHALWVWNSYPTEELVGAEHLLVPGNEIPFDKELKKKKQIWINLLNFSVPALNKVVSSNKADTIQENI